MAFDSALCAEQPLELSLFLFMFWGGPFDHRLTRFFQYKQQRAVLLSLFVPPGAISCPLWAIYFLLQAFWLAIRYQWAGQHFTKKPG